MRGSVNPEPPDLEIPRPDPDLRLQPFCLVTRLSPFKAGFSDLGKFSGPLGSLLTLVHLNHFHVADCMYSLPGWPLKRQGEQMTMSTKLGLGPLVAMMVVGTSLPASAAEDDWKTWVNKYMSDVVKLAANAPEVIAAVQEQNAANAGITPNQIEALDRQWRAEQKVKGGPLSNAKMFNPTSEFLKGFKTATNGPIVEIFIMDNKGLNVAQTDPTSDYMQGDEDKWQKTFGAGPWITFIDKPEEEDGKKTVQVSTTLVDNDVAIGAMTVTLDLAKVPTQ
jgi:hypothetical protein